MRKFTYKLTLHEIEVILDGRDIIINAAGNRYFTTYPLVVEAAEKHLIDLMVWILFYNTGELVKDDPVAVLPAMSRNYGNTLLCYSGGMDSSALLVAFPDMVPVYINRSWDPKYNESQLPAIEKANALIIDTDFELIRKIYKPDAGFNCGIGYLAMMFPLVDILKVDYFTFGGVFDDYAFWYGDPFSFSNTGSTYYKVIDGIIQRCGLGMGHVFAGVSEVLTTKLVESSYFKDVACPCNEPCKDSNFCGSCFKCFRKSGILGRRLDFGNKDIHQFIMKIIRKKPLKMAPSTVYAIQQTGYDEPWFDRFMDIDVTFTARYNEEIIKNLTSPAMFSRVIEKLHGLGIEKQTDADYELISKFVKTIGSDNLYR